MLSAMFEIKDTDSASVIRDKTLSYLEGQLQSYAGGNVRFGIAWNALHFATIALSAAASLVAALDHEIRWAIIGLPAASAFLLTLLLQLRVKDLWQLRDEGRIDLKQLHMRAQLIAFDDRRSAVLAATELTMAAVEIERDQSRRFFSTMGQKSVSTRRRLQNRPSANSQ